MPGVVAIVALDLASPPVTVITIPIDVPTTTSQVSTTTNTSSTTATPSTTTATTPPTTTATAPPTTTTATTVEVSDDGAIYILTGVILAAVLLVAVILLLMRRAGRERQAAAETEAGPTLTERVRELSEQAMMESAPDRLDEAAIAELYPWISTEEGIIIDLGDDDALASPDRNHDSRGGNGSS